MIEMYEDIILYIINYLIPCEVCRFTFVEDDPIIKCSICNRSWCLPCLQEQRYILRINNRIICKYCMYQERPIINVYIQE